MIGLGRILAEAREARGATLEEVEWETRIARRYLLALEEEDFDAFPAKVQARGFLRVYATYLGLDSAEMLALFPDDAQPESPANLVQGNRLFRETPRPSFEFPAAALSRPPLVIVGTLLAAVLIAGAFNAVCASGTERANAALMELSGTRDAGSFRVPDVREQTLQEAIATLERAGLRPLVIEVPSDRVAAGLVISQSPPPGTVVVRTSDVTLVASRGRP